MQPDLPRLEELLREAWAAREKAYAPYSGYRVGAALLGEGGRMYRGCNVENAAYPATVCAERTALLSAVADGERRFVALAVVAGGPHPPAPCGLCRQALAEFGKNLVVIAQKDRGEDYVVFSLEDLFPAPFRL